MPFEDLKAGTLGIPVEIDMTGLRGQLRRMGKETEQAGDAAVRSAA